MTLVRGGPRPLRDPRLVELPPALLDRATAVGKLRFILAKERGQVDSFHEDNEDSHVMGARGEAAFCYAYGVKWDETYDTFGKVPDQSPNWEIRTTSSLRFLKVRTAGKGYGHDDPTRLVTFVQKKGENLWLVLTRFILARDAQKRYPKRDPGNRDKPAHFVPAEHLLPITDYEHTIHAWWPVAGAERTWECFFGHETFKVEAPLYEWPNPIELRRRDAAATPRSRRGQPRVAEAALSGG